MVTKRPFPLNLADCIVCKLPLNCRFSWTKEERSLIGLEHRIPRYQSWFSFSVLYDALLSWGLAYPGGTASPRAIPGDSNDSPCKCAFQVQTKQPKAHTPNLLLYQALAGLLHARSIFPALITPGPGTR